MLRIIRAPFFLIQLALSWWVACGFFASVSIGAWCEDGLRLAGLRRHPVWLPGALGVAGYLLFGVALPIALGIRVAGAAGAVGLQLAVLALIAWIGKW